MTTPLIRTPQQLQDQLACHLATHWATHLTDPKPWPRNIPLGTPRSKDAAQDFATLYRDIQALNTAATSWGATLKREPRHVAGTTQQIPTHLIVPTLDHLATIAGDPWPTTITTGRHHLHQLTTARPDLTAQDLNTLLRAINTWHDTDVQQLIAVASRFRSTGPVNGLTARQIGLPGLDAKWLERHTKTVKTLAGLDDLGIIKRPSTINFTYLDPDYLATNHRRHDSYTLGDHHHLAYQPRTVIICENDDTALYYPPTPHAIAVRGSGHAATRLATIDWITNATHLIYWGDIDQHGYLILNNLRAALARPVPSVHMNQATYNSYVTFGTRTDAKGRPIKITKTAPPQHLQPDEQVVYDRLTDPEHTGPLRIEQECMLYPRLPQ